MKKIISIGFILLIISITSCNKEEFLKIKNEPDKSLWTTLGNFEMAVVAPLHMLFADAWSSPLGSDEYQSYLGADISGTPVIDADAGPSGYPIYYRQQRTTAVIESETAKRFLYEWREMYEVINASNDALDFVAREEKAKGGQAFDEVTPDVYNATMPRMKAEILFDKAYAYFSLAWTYCPPFDPAGANSDKLLPLKTSFSSDANELRTPVLGSTKEIYDLIIADLVKAKSLMPKSYNVDGRPNYYAISGLLARVYFFMGNFQAAKAECDEIIGSNNYHLQSDVMAAWNKNVGEDTAPEVIMNWVPTPTRNMSQWNFTIYTKMAPWFSNGGRGKDWGFCGWVKFHMSYSMLKYIDWMKDPKNGDYSVTANALADKRYRNTWYRLEGYVAKPSGMSDAVYNSTYPDTVYMKNYIHLTQPTVWLDKYYRGKNGYVTKVPLMRVAEFYLTRSIIRFNTGDKNGAAADLKVIRDRAGLPEITAATITADDIHRERVKEIGDENGDRIKYLMALRLPLGLSDRKADGSEGAVVNPPYSHSYWRIPEDEVVNNSSYPKGWVQPN